MPENSSQHRALNPDTAGDHVAGLWQGDGMATWIVLLRGVNVGGANKLAMSDLRALVTNLGHSDVSTYIQSGNVVLTSPRDDRATLAAEITAGIEAILGTAISAVLRTPDELRAALVANPFRTEKEGSRVLITFLSEVPADDDIARLEPRGLLRSVRADRQRALRPLSQRCRSIEDDPRLLRKASTRARHRPQPQHRGQAD